MLRRSDGDDDGDGRFRNVLHAPSVKSAYTRSHNEGEKVRQRSRLASQLLFSLAQTAAAVE